ncbi:Ig-like domain-containing protein [Peribacillus kribbensis]|uniref:Ig-like domain-containing protein n=1 Tax=Peribacillus kribbensis TaxID=356658 RepID=UPI00047EB74B|nr:Ig-like domain-containing protein [Peribacillus kribbensis]
MKRITRRITCILIAPILMWTLFAESISAADQPSVDEFSRPYKNYDLSQTMEYYPYPLFSWNQGTLKWEQKQNVDLKSGMISYAAENEPNANHSMENEMKVGNDSSGGYETYMKFGKSLHPLDGGLLVWAQLRLHEQGNDIDCYYCDSYGQNEQYAIYKVLEPWSVERLTWADKPDISEIPAAVKTKMKGTESGWFIWDVSDLVSQWYKNPSSDHGIAIRAAHVDDSGSLRVFDKLSAALTNMPVLQVKYSPKPEAPTAITYGHQPNSSQGTVKLQWTSVTGAKGYRMYMYNGTGYEKIYEGQETSWTSLGKNIWPTNQQITSGDYSLKKDGTGTELSDEPGKVYRLNGDSTSQPDSYYFKVSAYNDYGETDLSDVRSVKMPKTSQPDIPRNVKASSELLSNFTLSWDPVTGIQGVRYMYQLSRPGGQVKYAGATDSNRITIPENELAAREEYDFSVKSVYDGGYSDYSAPLRVTARKKLDSVLVQSSIPFGPYNNWSPTLKIALKNMGNEPWTKDSGYTLKAGPFSVELDGKEVIRPGDIKEFVFRLPDDMPLGTSEVTWQMYNQNDGYFGDRLSKELTLIDSAVPFISLASPADGHVIKGKIKLQGTISDFRLTQYSVSFEDGHSPGIWKMISSGTQTTSELGEWDTTGLANGTYKLRIEAKDAAGNEAVKDYTISVGNPLPAPAVNGITDQSILVSGRAVPNSRVLVTQNGNTLGSGFASKDGSFSISFPKQRAGTQILVYSEDEIVESGPVSLIVKDVTPPAQPIVQTVTNMTAAIIGKTEPKASVTVKIGNSLYTKVADGAGNFSVGIPIQNSGTAISITAKDAAKLQSKEVRVNVARVAPNIPAVNGIHNKSAAITGKAEKYGLVSAVSAGKTYSGKADASGNFKIGIPIQNSGSKVSVSVKDGAGKVSVSRSLTVSRIAPNMPVVYAVKPTSASVTGKTEGSVLVYVKIGTRTYSAKAGTNGSFKVTIPKQRKGTEVYVTAKDAKKAVSAARVVKVY